MTPTVTPKQTPALPPSPTPVPPELILADFPLSQGATWYYTAEISYQNPLVTWSGRYILSVIDEETTPDGRIIFTLQDELEPTPPQGVWRQPQTYEYIISGDGIFRGETKIFQWPLSDMLMWETMPGTNQGIVARYIGDVDTPYGMLTGCYNLTFTTNPDTSIKTFCPGVGYVEHSYNHHGTPQIEHFLLIDYVPGQ
jgi:hypothetical protein